MSNKRKKSSTSHNGKKGKPSNGQAQQNGRPSANGSGNQRLSRKRLGLRETLCRVVASLAGKGYWKALFAVLAIIVVTIFSLAIAHHYFPW